MACSFASHRKGKIRNDIQPLLLHEPAQGVAQYLLHDPSLVRLWALRATLLLNNCKFCLALWLSDLG